MARACRRTCGATIRSRLVDSNWDQPSKSFVATLNQTIGYEGDQHAAVLVLREQDRDHARRTGYEPRRRGHQQSAADFPVRHEAIRHPDESSRLLGRRALRGALERSAIPQQPGSVRHQRRLHAGVRQAFRESWCARQREQEERGHERQRLQHALGLLGRERVGGRRLGSHRQPSRQLPAERHVVGVLGAVDQPLGAAALARRRILRVGFMAGFPPRHGRLWPQILAVLQSVRGGRQDHQLRARLCSIRRWATTRAMGCFRCPARTCASRPAPGAESMDRTAR